LANLATVPTLNAEVTALLTALKNELIGGASDAMNTFKELETEILENEGGLTALSALIATKLNKNSNLEDLTDKAAALRALNVYTKTEIDSSLLNKHNNLLDLTNTYAARQNLGLGDVATLNKSDDYTTDNSNLIASSKAVFDLKNSLDSVVENTVRNAIEEQKLNTPIKGVEVHRETSDGAFNLNIRIKIDPYDQDVWYYLKLETSVIEKREFKTGSPTVSIFDTNLESRMRDFLLLPYNGAKGLTAEAMVCALFLEVDGVGERLKLRTYRTQRNSLTPTTGWSLSGNSAVTEGQIDEQDITYVDTGTTQGHTFGNSSDLRRYVCRIIKGKDLGNNVTEIFISTSKAYTSTNDLIYRAEINGTGEISNFSSFMPALDRSVSSNAWRFGIVGIEYSELRDSLYIAFGKTTITAHGYRSDTPVYIYYSNSIYEIPRNSIGTDCTDLANNFQKIGLSHRISATSELETEEIKTIVHDPLTFTAITDICIDGNLIYITDALKSAISVFKLSGEFVKTIPIGFGSYELSSNFIQDDPCQIDVSNEKMIVHNHYDNYIMWYV